MFPVVSRVDNNGFTLIEVMVAMIIMTIGMLALLQTVNLSIAYNKSNKLTNDAVILADEIIGRERTKYAISTFSNMTGGIDTIVHGTVTYNVTRTITDLTTRSKQLEVIISWPDKGVTKRHSLNTTIVNQAN